MQFPIRSAAVTMSAALITLCSAFPQAMAQAAREAGTTGRIAKFVTTTAVGNSVLFESAGRIGLGTAAPLSMLDIRGGGNALQLWGSRPYATFRDTLSSNARSSIQSSNGGFTMFGESYLNRSNPFAFLRIDREGKLGIGTASPTRAIHIGPDTNAMFTIEPSNASPNAGFIRFGDGTGWQLHFGRSRQGSGGALTTGTTGLIMSIKDNNPGGFGGGVIFHGAVQVNTIFASGLSPTPLCRNSLKLLSECSSSRRFKTDIRPFSGGLELIDRLQPVSFIWKGDGHSDIGLIAEDVAEVDPRLTFKSDDGEVGGVNFTQLATALINAVKEQQKMIKEQQATIDELQAAVARLERLDGPSSAE
jgi:hypothetical protein